MEFQGFNPSAMAKRRAYQRILDACGGDTEMADELVEYFTDDTPPSLRDLRALAARAEAAAESGEEDRCAR